jgi:hypothetical protein
MNHLTLEAFAASADGTPPGSAAEAHLAACPGCQAEARKWNAVGRGVRLLTAAYEPPPLFAAIGQLPARTPWRRRRVVLVSAAAAVVLGVTGYGLDSMLGSSARPAAGGAAPTSAAELAAALTPTECTRLEVAAGTLESVSGSRIVVRTGAGKLITVTASGSTQITRQVVRPLSDVKNGVQVFVDGSGSASGATIAAQSIALLPRLANGPKPPPARLVGRPDLGRLLAQRGHAAGTVTDAGSAGFTVVEPGGHRVRVTTTSATTVIEQANATAAELQKGKLTVAVGTPQANGTLAAASIQQNALVGGLGGVGHMSGRLPAPDTSRLPSGLPRPGSRPPFPLPNRPKGPFSGLGCDSGAIATTAMLRAGS